MLYEVKVKTTKELENGEFKNKSEKFIMNAVSLTDVDEKMNSYLPELYKSFEIQGATVSKIEHVEDQYSGDVFYQIGFETIDEDGISGKEKKTKHYVLVAGNSDIEARNNIAIELEKYIVPTVVFEVKDSKIVDYVY